MSSSALFEAGWITPESYYRLTDQISAFEIAYSEDGAERFGLICRLPTGAELEVCGDGFNHRTLKVRYGEQCYFVFLQDLDLQKSQPITERCRNIPSGQSIGNVRSSLSYCINRVAKLHQTKAIDAGSGVDVED
jgi:hypothetical protein